MEPSTLNTSFVQYVFKLQQPRYRSRVVAQLARGSWLCGGEIAVWVDSGTFPRRKACYGRSVQRMA